MDVPDQIVNDIHVTHIAAFLLALLDAAHRTQRGATCFIGRSASINLLPDPRFQVKAQFFIQLPFDFPAAKN